MPEPKIIKKTKLSNHHGSVTNHDYSQYNNHNHHNVKEEEDDSSSEEEEEEEEEEEVEEWVGVAGVDFFSNSRARKAFDSTPGNIHTQCFIFPICHDAALYGRVMEIQAARRNIAPILLDPVILNCIEEERQNIIVDSFYIYMMEEDQQREYQLLLQKQQQQASSSSSNNHRNGKSKQQQQKQPLSEVEKLAMETKIRARAQAAAARLHTMDPKLSGLENILPTHR